MTNKSLDKSEGENASKWNAPVMDARSNRVIRYQNARDNKQQSNNSATDSIKIPTAEEIQKWQKDAEAEGYQQGLKQAEAEIQSLKDELKTLINFIEQPLKYLNEEIEQQLTQVAVTLAQQLVRRELKIDPGEIVGLIRESVQLLPGNSRKIRIFLHPDDAELVKNVLQLDENDEEQSWKLIEDPMMTRGGCEIKSEQSVINASLENRLSQLAASVLGGEREEDQNDG